MVTSSAADMAVISELQLQPGTRMSRESAEAILQWQFTATAHEQMRQLLEKNREGTITAEETDLLDAYGRVGLMLDIMRAEARQTLREPTAD